MKKNIFLIMSIIFIFYGQLNSQSVYIPLQHEIYDFLKRMESKHLLEDIRDAALPFSRIQAAKYLIGLENKVDGMTKVERETYEFLTTEFKYEILKILGDEEPSEIRWHVYSHELTNGIINFDINYSVSKMFSGKNSNYYRSQGFKTYGYVYNDIGFYFNIVDNLERGDNIDYGRLSDIRIDACPFLTEQDKEYYKRIKSPLRGVVLSQLNNKNQYQYDEIDATLSWQTGDFIFSLEKINNYWGYGRRGSVVLSDNAPSYPQIKMQVPLSKNISFIYFHGELNSNIVDSARTYRIIYDNPSYTKYRIVEHNKYIAAHQIEFSIWNGVDLALGESIIYSNRGPLFIYLIPVMFFKAAEHYNEDKDNCQIFGSLDLNLIKGVNYYLTLFIDEINTDKIFDGHLSRRQVAFTSGIKIFDIPARNIDFTMEYTRINPAVYNHSVPALTFENNGSFLGNWMGQNSDNIFWELGLMPKHGLRFSIYGEVFRKGGILPIADQYSENQGQKSFLFGPFHEERSIGFTAKYQPLRDLFIDIKGRFHKIKDEINISKNQPSKFEFSVGARLGLW